MQKEPDSLPVQAAITGLGVYLPSTILTNHELAKIVDTTDDWVVQRTGIRERRLASASDTTLSMGVAAARDALASANLAADQLDLIICATLIPEHPFPSTACLAQEALGASRAGAFDLSAACAGFIYALSVARAYILSGAARNVLIIGSETMSRVLDWQDRATCVLFGDGAGAVVIQAQPYLDKLTTGSIEAVVIRSDGSKGEHLMIPAGGSKAPASAATVAARQHFIHMNGPEVFKGAVRCMSEACLEAIKQADLSLAAIDLMVAHQANARIIQAIQHRLGLPEEKVFQNLQYYGNTSGASIPIALYDAVKGGYLKNGMQIVVAGFGGGYAWGAAVLKWGQVALKIVD